MNFNGINAEIAHTRLELNVEEAEKAIQKEKLITQMSVEDLEYQQIETVIPKWGKVIFIMVSRHWIVIDGSTNSGADGHLSYPIIDTDTALKEGIISELLVENLEKAQKELDNVNSIPDGQKHVNEAIQVMGIDNVRRYINAR
jgi:hypothetical protein